MKGPGECVRFPKAKRSQFDVIDREHPERSPEAEYFTVSLRQLRRIF
jgi:hypothetical protein